MATVTESELMFESNEIYTQKKQAAKHMNVIGNETAKMHKIQKSTLNRLKDYKLYHKNGWVAGNPLVLDKQVDYPDKLSPIFIKLFQIVEDLRAVGDTSFLDPYVASLESQGIKIYIDQGTPIVSDKDEVMSNVDSMGTFQKQVNALSKEINEVKAIEADDINLTAAKEFPKLVAFYNKKEEGKDVDDIYQNAIADFELRENGYNKVFDGSLS